MRQPVSTLPFVVDAFDVRPRAFAPAVDAAFIEHRNRRMVAATRNIRGFDDTGVETANPWAAA